MVTKDYWDNPVHWRNVTWSFGEVKLTYDDFKKIAETLYPQHLLTLNLIEEVICSLYRPIHDYITNKETSSRLTRPKEVRTKLSRLRKSAETLLETIDELDDFSLDRLSVVNLPDYFGFISYS